MPKKQPLLGKKVEGMKEEEMKRIEEGDQIKKEIERGKKKNF